MIEDLRQFPYFHISICFGVALVKQCGNLRAYWLYFVHIYQYAKQYQNIPKGLFSLTVHGRKVIIGHSLSQTQSVDAMCTPYTPSFAMWYKSTRGARTWTFNVTDKSLSWRCSLSLQWCMAAPSEKVSFSMRKLCGFISSYTCSHSHPGICFPSKLYIISMDSVCGQQRPRSDCADAQADLGFHYPHMPEDTFLHGMAHFLIQAEIWLWK